MFRNKKKNIVHDKLESPDDHLSIIDKLDNEKFEPFTADEALNRTIDGKDEAFKQLSNKAFEEINEAIKRGEYQTKLTTYFVAHDINAKRLSDYLIDLGYKAELDTNGLYAGQEPVYRLIVDWGDEDENA